MTKTKVALTFAALALVLVLAISVAGNVQAQAGTPAPGLYVTDLKIDPNPPTVGNTFTFTPSFLNSSNNPLTFTWRVLIYRSDTPNKSYADTTWTDSSFATGTSTPASLGGWTLPSGTPCDWYFASVVWQDANNNEVPFTTPDGKVFEKGFNTCGAPVTTAPAVATSVPSTANGATGPTPAPTSAPSIGASSNTAVAPGLYVSDLKIDPSPPRVGNTFTFTPAFANTSNNPLTVTWRVLIYRADTPNKSYADTTWTDAIFHAGSINLPSLGYWKLPSGTACDWYFARVVWQDADNNEVPFTTTDGKVFEKGFTTCP